MKKPIMNDYITSLFNVDNPTKENTQQLFSYTIALEAYIVELEKKNNQ